MADTYNKLVTRLKRDTDHRCVEDDIELMECIFHKLSQLQCGDHRLQYCDFHPLCPRRVHFYNIMNSEGKEDDVFVTTVEEVINTWGKIALNKNLFDEEFDIVVEYALKLIKQGSSYHC